MSFYENEIQDVCVDGYIYGFDYSDSCSYDKPKGNKSMIHGFDYSDSCSYDKPKGNKSMIHGFDYSDSCSYDKPKGNKSEIKNSQDLDLNKKKIMKNTTFGRFKVHFGDDLLNKGLSNKIFGRSSYSMKEKKTIKLVSGVVDTAVDTVVKMIEKVQSWNERLNYQC